jgi:hypothetical protein
MQKRTHFGEIAPSAEEKRGYGERIKIGISRQTGTSAGHKGEFGANAMSEDDFTGSS